MNKSPIWQSRLPCLQAGPAVPFMIHAFLPTSSFFPVILCALLWMTSGTTAFADQNNQRIVFLGDSITAGYGLKKEQAYPKLIETLAAAQGIPITSVNAGLSGDTTRGGLRRLKILVKKPVDICVIALGGNDGLRGIPPEVSQANLTAMVDLIRKAQPNAKVLVAGMQMPNNMGENYTQAFRKIFATVAKEKKTAHLPFLLEGIAGSAEHNLPDRIHPNAKGQTVIAQHVFKALLPLLKK